MFRTSVCAAALAAMLCAVTPAAAQGRSVTVSYSDLNLKTDKGRESFDRRVTKAAWAACDAMDSQILSIQAANKRCVADTLADARPAIEAALNGGTATLASRDASITLKGAR